MIYIMPLILIALTTWDLVISVYSLDTYNFFQRLVIISYHQLFLLSKRTQISTEWPGLLLKVPEEQTRCTYKSDILI